MDVKYPGIVLMGIIVIGLGVLALSGSNVNAPTNAALGGTDDVSGGVQATGTGDGAGESEAVNAGINSLSGVKFNDANNNGIRDSNEAGLPGWTITLTGPVDSTTATDADGFYEFTGLPDGTYTVCETMQSGYVQTAPVSGATCADGYGYSVTIVDGSSSASNDFGNRIPNGTSGSGPVNVGGSGGGGGGSSSNGGSQAAAATNTISAVKFNDTDGDGVHDADESGLANVTIYLDADNNNNLDSGETNANTDSNGQVSFSGLSDGTYYVREVLQTGWVQTTSNPQTVSVAGGQSATVHIGNTPSEGIGCGVIFGLKFRDDNGDGLRDAGEPALSGWTIFLDQNQNGTLDSGERNVVTDGNGNYVFSNLPAGTYYVREVQQAEWNQTTPNPAPIVIPDCQADFGNQPLPRNVISGIKFKDLNLNGLRDASEPGLFGWTIFIDANNNSLLDSSEASTTTDGNGSFTFSNLTAGTYIIREVQQSGWVQTTPDPAPRTVAFGQNITGVMFGNAPEVLLPNNAISGMKFHDADGDGVQDAGEPGLENWTITLSSSDVSSSTVTDSDGIYEFTGLPSDVYTVCETLQAGWTQTFPASGASCPDGFGHSVNVTGGASSVNNNFGNAMFVSHIEIIKKSIGTSGTFNFTGTLGDFQITTVLVESDANVYIGSETFLSAPIGTHSVSEQSQLGWNLTVSGCIDGSSPSSFGVNADDHVVCIFVNEQVEIPLNVISGVKFNDLNGNGVRDEGEPGLANWTITLASESSSATTQTDEIGFYEFTGVADNSYTVCETLQSGWAQTMPSSGATCPDGFGYAINVSGGQSSADNDFGNQQLPGVISGVKFKDLDSDGVRDANEPGLFGWTIFIDANGNGTLDSGETSTTTGADGNYSFTLPAGTYTVYEVQQSGWTQTTPNPDPILLGAGQSVTGVDFGNSPFAQASISGMKVEDINHNGQLDPGEGVVAGWTFFIDENGNGLLDSGEATVVTDANGTYTFSGLAAGTYVVCEEMQAGWMQIFPSSGPDCNGVNGFSVAVAAGESVTGVDFGNQNFQAANSISGAKFEDVDGNGARDSGEAGLSGWTIYMDQNQNSVLDSGEMSTVTGSDGSYTFENLIPGTYYVREVQQENWTQTTANPAGITVSSGTVATGVDFGNQRVEQLNSVSGMKFNDMDGDGVQDAGEPGLEGWTITLSGPVSMTTQTDVDGLYEFTGLPDGTYTICETLQSGWAQTFPTSGADCGDGTMGHTVAGGQGSSSINNNFGNMQITGSISGVKVEDINHNGQLDPGEGVVEGWTFFIDENGNGALDSGEPTAVTDANGAYTFSELLDGTYTVCEEMRDGWMQIYPSSGPDCGDSFGLSVTVVDGGDAAGNDFGNQNVAATNAISGMKFNDSNSNGTLDSGEVGLSGWTIYLDQNQNSVLDSGETSTVTDSSGNYLFTNMLPGTYYVREVQQSGWTQTTSNPAPITLVSADAITGVDFGNFNCGGTDPATC